MEPDANAGSAHGVEDLRRAEQTARERLWWLFAIGIYGLAFFVPLVAGAIILGIRGVDEPDQGSTEIAIASSPIIGVLLAAGSLWAAGKLRLGADVLGWRWAGFAREWRNIALGLGIVVALFAFGFVYEQLLGAFGIELDPLAPYEAARTHIVLVVVLVATSTVIAPFGEELFYRGFLLTMLGRQFRRRGRAAWMRGAGGRWLAVILVSILFALSHALLAAMAQLFVFALMLGWARLRTGSLTAPIAAHVVNNAISVTVLLLT